MNTKISYLYRDADNYKAYNECVIPGIITKEQQKRILGSLDEGEYFIPSLVGLPEKKFDKYDPEADHPFFELGPHSFEETSAEPTVDITPEELAKAFEAHTSLWYAIEPSRTAELLDMVINDLIEQEGGHAGRVAEHLLDIGFTRCELLTLQFSEGVIPKEADVDE